jgi:MFS family permease
MAAYFLHIMTFYFLVKWVPKLVTDMGYAPGLAGSVLVWANVGGALGSLTMGLLTLRYNVRTLCAASMVLGAAAIVWFGQPHDGLLSLSLVAGLGGFLLNGATVGLYAMFAQSFPARLRGSGTGMIIGVGRGGAALAPVLAGALLSAGFSVAIVASLLACGSLFGAMALVLLRYREPKLA